MGNDNLFHELSYYTLAQPRDEFIHQYVVDAYGAQTASPSNKPTRLVFSLVGLYLHVDRGCNGREVQRIHTKLARRRPRFPEIDIPSSRGAVSIADVLDVPPGPERNQKIDEWCKSVWLAFRHNRGKIEELLGDLVPQ